MIFKIIRTSGKTPPCDRCRLRSGQYVRTFNSIGDLMEFVAEVDQDIILKSDCDELEIYDDDRE